MIERPILFSGPMVRAILDGSKSQTRRVVRGQKRIAHDVTNFNLGAFWGWAANDAAVRELGSQNLQCPYGTPGERLWVRESFTWRRGNGIRPWYRADGEQPTREDGQPIPWDAGPRWHPSIHMPRRICRITLEVTDVRVERLQDISEDDARAEGVDDGPGRGSHVYPSPRAARGPLGHRGVFRELWDTINGKRAPWASNPWVWAVSFRRVA